MKMQSTIPLSKFCDRFHVDIEILREFADFGLYSTVSVEGEIGIDVRDLARLEKVMSLHQALGVNKEGIDVILELRQRISGLQQELELLLGEVEKLRRYSASDEPEALKVRGLLIEVED